MKEKQTKRLVLENCLCFACQVLSPWTTNYLQAMQPIYSLLRSFLNRSEGRLRGVHHVQESISVLFRLIELAHCHRVGHHRAFVDQQEESLLRMKLQSSSHNRHELGNRNMFWYQELATIHQWKASFRIESFDDYRNLVWLLTFDLFDISFSFIWKRRMKISYSV